MSVSNPDLVDDPAEWWRLPDHLGIEVLLGAVPEELPGGQRVTRQISVAGDRALVRLGKAVRMLVERGRKATLQLPEDPIPPGQDPMPGQHQWRAGDAGWLVQGWVVPLAILQRGGLVLHASCVDLGGRVVAVAGDSGSGKSTTAMALRARGHRLLVDDVTLVELGEQHAWMLPFSRNVHLLPDAAQNLGIDFTSLPRLAGGREKAAFIPEDPGTMRRRIDSVVVLTPAGEVAGPTLESLSGPARVAVLLPHTQRGGVAAAILGQQRFFELVTELAASVPLWRLQRPSAKWTLAEVVSLVEAAAG